MAIFIPLKQGSLLIPSGPIDSPETKHLFVICTEPSPEKEFLLVGISTWRGLQCDAICILEPEVGIEFIQQRSYVVYRRARVEKADTLIQGVKSGLLVAKPSIPKETFERICDGIMDSPHTPLRYRRFFNDHFGS